MTDIPSLVNSAWITLNPLLPIIAAKGAEEIGKRAVSEVWDLVKKKFETKEAAKETLTDLLQNPQDDDAKGAFRLQLKKFLNEDSDFAGQLSKLLESAGSDFKAQNIGNGAIAQGAGAKAVGAGGVMVGGNVNGNIVVGDKNKIETKKG